MTNEYLIARLKAEKEHSISGGIYNMTQIDMAYNSNHIEGSTLSHEQTRFIYDTHSLIAGNSRVDDIIETTNHFRCFDIVIDNYDTPISENFIKDLHKQLKTGTFNSQGKENIVGEYKIDKNYVGNIVTTPPSKVRKEIKELIADCNSRGRKSLDEILDFHARFEKIHPFYDGNGRVGRLIMFKECLANDVTPFVIRDEMKDYYLRGINEWQRGGEKGYLRELCESMQDEMHAKLQYFEIPYLHEEEPKRQIFISGDVASYIQKFLDSSSKVPSFSMICGIPGSGKQEKAEQILSSKVNNSAYIRSKTYWEEYGEYGADVVFSKIRNAISTSLSNGIDVVYSATNLTKELRMSIIKDCVDPYHARKQLYVCYVDPTLSSSDEPENKLYNMAVTLRDNKPNMEKEGWDRIVISGEEPDLSLFHQKEIRGTENDISF